MQRDIFLNVIVCAVSLGVAGAQNVPVGIDPQIAAMIARIKAIDNHAHPVLPPPGMSTDRDFDALPVDSMEPETDPVAWRPDNPQLLLAWKALWGFEGAVPLKANDAKRLDAAREKVRARLGLRYDEWVLARAGIGTMLANRVTMGPGIAPPRFAWVPYDDALVFPLDNSGLAEETPDKKLFFQLESKVLARYLEVAGLRAVPATLDEYLTQLVLPTLARQRKGGAVAVKFEIAYLRDLGFTNPSQADAQRVYDKFANHGKPEAAGYRVLQDYLFRAIAMECGRLGLVVHIHAMSGGGGYFGISGANPLRLESVFNDSHLRGVKFVMLHGGWPFVREAGALLEKPNVYLDISQQSLTFSARTLSGWLREWLEVFPDKVLYGTDAYPFTPALGWEESAWIADRTARQALGLALTGMVRDGEISRERAGKIAEGVLRGTAQQLYGLRGPKI